MVILVIGIISGKQVSVQLKITSQSARIGFGSQCCRDRQSLHCSRLNSGIFSALAYPDPPYLSGNETRSHSGHLVSSVRYTIGSRDLVPRAQCKIYCYHENRPMNSSTIFCQRVPVSIRNLSCPAESDSPLSIIWTKILRDCSYKVLWSFLAQYNETSYRTS